MPETTDPAPEPTPTPTPPPAAQAKAGPKPPWGSDDEFNPEKAWALLQNVRGDLTETKANLETARKEAAELQEFRVKAQEAEDTAQETALSLHRERAARKHGLNEEQFEFLAELTDPEAIDKRAELVATSLASKPVRPVDPAQGTSSETKAEPADQFADFITKQLGRTSTTTPS